jgi:Xaa-Pro dipeptidase
MDAAYAGAFGMLRPGALETEVLGAAMAGMFAAGGEFPAIVPPMASGPRTMSKTHGSAVARRILPNEPVTIEPASSRHRYHAIGVQTRWTGEPPKEVQKAFDGIMAVHDAAKQSIRANISTAVLAAEIDRGFKDLNMFRPNGHHGYGTGIGFPPTWVDTLRIKDTDTHILERNTTFYLMGHWTVRGASEVLVELFVGEPILVTENGHERLSSTPLSLV